MDLKQYRSKLIGTDDKRAVSPVIGVILMVAITVILAAVIAAFVLDLGQGQSANAQAGVEFSEETGNVTVSVTKVSRADALYISGTESCSYLYDDSGDTAGDEDNPQEEKEISASAGASKTIHIGGNGAENLDVDHICDSSDGSSYTHSSATNGKIQIIGEYDGSRSVLTEFELS